MQTSKFKAAPKEGMEPQPNPAAKPIIPVPVLRERHPYLRIVIGDIKIALTMLHLYAPRKEERAEVPQQYDPLAAAHERSKRGF